MRAPKPIPPAAVRLVHLLALLLVSVTLGFSAAMAETDPPADAEAAELIGAVVFAADGSRVGEVTAVSMGADGRVAEIRMTMPSRLGLGDKTVILPSGSFMILRGAVVLDLSRDQVDALPSAPPRSGT